MSAPTTPFNAANPSFLITSSSTPAPPPASAPPFPSPSTFDVIPPLHTLLTRLLTTTTQPPDHNPTHTVEPESGKWIEIQQLPTEASRLKIKLQKARMAILALPDVDRTCEEQEVEIRELEERVGKLRNVLKGLAEAHGNDQSVGQGN
ncbi:hypothetical protein K432DRAFT_153024 [Lepidopterella palustris CBS 459.81]|uniref:Mediator of RNA polymerase II transcription subunit 9 n=1 Tax=Lepidopterella palustris CBS 459.81 TaxID=1314670 RepID=A0A8E2E2H4_9PEZI|nr:hypothetical protein K432DRAFT_153024 [Lepidopterella palustris CBS 459.81]